MEKKHNRPGKIIRKKDDFLNGSITKEINRYDIYHPAVKNSQEVENYRTLNKKSL